MKIKKIELKNYRQYTGKVEINLGSSKERNVNVIVGRGGAGKTNIYNAIVWCLYGEEPYIDARSKDFGLLNESIIGPMDDGGVKEVYVQLELVTNENETYTIKRSIDFRKNGDGVETVGSQDGESDGTKFVAHYYGRGTPAHETTRPVEMIEKILPGKIKNYFFFDGEKLANYFNEQGKRNIEEAIADVSQLDTLQKINERLNTVTREFQNESKDQSPRHQNLIGEIESLTEKKVEAKKELAETLRLKEGLDSELSNFVKKYADLGGKKATELLKENEILGESIEKYETELEEITTEKRTSIFKFAYAFLGNKAIFKSQEIFEEARKNKEIPPNIDYDYLKGLLDEGVCICGEKLDGKDAISKRKTIKKTMDGISDVSKNVNLYQEISQETDALIQQLHSAHARIGEYSGRVKKLKEELDAAESKVNANYAEIRRIATASKVDIEGVGNFENRIKQITDEKEKKIREETQYINNLAAIEEELSGKNSELKKENDKEEKGKYLNKCIESSEAAAEGAKKIIEKILGEMREEISNKTEEHFANLMPAKERNKIAINENYEITVLEREKNRTYALSKGQQTMLAVSFITALNSVSGFNAPIVMDSVLGRIDVEVRNNFARKISTYLKDTQIILLALDSEYTGAVKEEFKDHIFSEHSIVKESNTISKIKIRN